jgi:beta-galactosidase
MSDIKIENGAIVIDGKPEQIISGAIHYFRVLPELWEDRLKKAKMCGLNAIETYMCWNLHEPREGEFDFSGMLDFEEYIRIAHRLGLYVIVRPGPYICAEWENGGFPAWLMVKNGIKFRCMNQPYLEASDRFFNEILPRVKKLQYTEGGPVIAMQIENEYGSYGNDKQYLNHVKQLFIDNGIDVPLFTSDGASDNCILGGTVPDVMMTLNFGSNPAAAFAKGREYRPEGPDFCMEYWNGWFDHWKEAHHTRSTEDAAKTLEEMLSTGASVNFYMFHGGTNFNFWNGSNYMENRFLAPTITSYDYDAALSECGDPSPKFFAYQEIIKKYRPDADFGTPECSTKKAYGKTQINGAARLLDNLDTLGSKHQSVTPPTMEELGQNFGFIHYRTKLSGPVLETELHLYDVRDRALLFLDGKYLATYFRNDDKYTFKASIPKEGAVLDILVENMGRINYGPYTGKDLKGIVGGVSISLQYQFGNWSTWTLPMDNLDKLSFSEVCPESNDPAFFRAELDVDEPADTFLKFPGKKGNVWINGFNIGRYWEVGPQKTLYVPAPLLKKGKNEIIIFEQHELYSNEIEFSDTPELG